MQLDRIGLIGYGEVGKTFSTGLKGKPGVAAMSAWDLKFAAPVTRDAELARGNVQAALAAYRQAVHWQPDLVPAYVGLAAGYWRLGQRDAAAAALLQASRIDPDHPAVQALRAEIDLQP